MFSTGILGRPLRSTASGRRRGGPHAAGLCLVALLAGSCNDGLGDLLGSSGEDPGPDPGPGPGPSGGNHTITGEDGGPAAPPLAAGSVATRLEVELPSATDFVLRGTLPVPPGTFPRSDGKRPFAIRDTDGTLLETQNELVTRYANDADGAEVVEVIARARRSSSKSPGSRGFYDVVVQPTGSVADPGTAGVEDLSNATRDLPQAVLDLLADPKAIRISTKDVFGNQYACYPLDGTGTMRVERYGTEHSQLRVFQTMMPEPPVPGGFGTLPHSFGVHTYISTLRGEDTILFDVRFNNGHSGNDKSTPVDDPLDKVYFERIEVAVPSGWVLQQTFDDPFFGAAYLAGTKSVTPVVSPVVGGLMHVMRWQGQFHRRLALSPSASVSRARMYLDGYGQGFCRRGTDPTQGHEYWSWWNPGTDRYWTQDHQLPSLDHIGQASLRNTLAGTLTFLSDHLRDGTGDGVYPVQSAVLGWGHPYGVPYGGATSGAEIYMFDGVETAEAASREGLQATRATHRMHTDRMPNALYDRDGDPTCVEDWVVRQGPPGDYVPFDFYGVPILRPGDPFGFDQAPRFQIQQVEGTARTPPYEATHFTYDPTDLQHLVRYTRSPKVLIWLTNDPLSKDDVWMQAETGHLSFHRYNNASGGGQQATGLRYKLEDVAASPGIGFEYGRGEAWLLDAMTATYAFQDDAWRTAHRPWFDLVTGLVFDGQSACSGFVQSMVRPKFLNGQYRARQMIEQSIMENAFRGVRETVYRGEDSTYTAMMGQVLIDSVYAFVSDMAWFPGESAPWTHTAVGPKDYSKPVYCSYSQIPKSGYNPQYESYQVWASFAYGYDLSADPLFLDKARLMIGANNLLFGLEGAGLSNIWNQAPTLAAVQRLNGILP